MTWRMKWKLLKRLKWILGGALLILVVIVAVIGVYVYIQLNKDTIKLGNTNGELAFISDRDGDWDVYLLYPDGTLVNLTEESDGHEYFHNFSFNGDVVSFYSSKSGEITPGMVKADGGGFKTMSWMEAFASVVTDGRTDNDPAWNPGGEQMVWSKMKNFGVNLFIANSDGSDEGQLVDKGPTDSAPAWAPDGTRLAFLGDTSDDQSVYVMDINGLEGGEAVQLTDDKWDFQPVWSKDGTRILFARDQDESLLNGDLTMMIMNADGSDLRPFTDADEFEGDLTYSPHDGQVAYMSNEDGYWHIYVMDADGSNVRRVTDGDYNHLFPAWRPVPADEQVEQPADEPADGGE